VVLTAVFIPMAFFSGSTGVIYRQFSITLVAAMSISLVVALILTPALCAIVLKPNIQPTKWAVWVNQKLDRLKHAYVKLVHHTLRLKALIGVV
ncbi:efflux RND transporter permease subunit, partial [Acinetobacter nosocomialis]